MSGLPCRSGRPIWYGVFLFKLCLLAKCWWLSNCNPARILTWLCVRRLKRHIPRQGFLLVDFKKHALNQFLQDSNLFALICRIQHNQGLADVSCLLQTFIEVCSESALLRDMAAWINQVILPHCLPKVDFPHHFHLKDVRTMLDDYSGSWLEQWETQGIQKGLQKGLRKGMQEGRAAERTKALLRARQTLQRQLRHKFGRLSQASQQTLSQAGYRQLSFWSLRLLDAQSLDDVFQAQPGARPGQ